MTDHDTRTATGTPTTRMRWLNTWPVVPLRIYLASVFLFGGYAKFNYPGFFDPKSSFGLKATIDAVKGDSPIGGALGPLSDHSSLFGHITAVAEIAIGLGLLVGLLTRIAAIGGIVLTGLIALTVNWSGIKQYTASSGWFTSVDLAVAAALSVFVLGGAGPLSLDWWIKQMRARNDARDDSEPSFRDSELEDSRRRLQGEPTGYMQPAYPAAPPPSYQPVQATPAPAPAATPAGVDSADRPARFDQPVEHPTEQLPAQPPSPPGTPAAPSGPSVAPAPAERGPQQQEENSLWRSGDR
jgi:thiosulfate dehydrogenase [quinone] large subunit